VANITIAAVIARPYWRQKLPKTATKVAVSGNIYCQKRRLLPPETATICHRFGQLLLPFSATIASATICRCFRQHLLPETETFVARNGDNLSPFRATFVAVFGDYSFGYNLSPFSATFVAGVDGLLGGALLCTCSDAFAVG